MALEIRQTAKAAAGAALFPATRWSCVVRAREGDDPAVQRQALDELCAAYWHPVAKYLEALGCGQETEDATQDFFAAFLRRAGFAQADREIGRLRAYLKTAVRHHFLHWRRDRSTQQRGGGVTPLSLDETTGQAMPVESDADAEAAYDQGWARTVLERALARLRQSYETRDRLALFEILKPVLLAVGTKIPDHQAEALGFTPNALTVEQHRARRRLATLLREEVAETVADPAEVDGELLHLLRVLSVTGRPAHE